MSDSINVNEVELSGRRYVAVDTLKAIPEVTADYVVVRSDRAGVFAGYLKSREGSEVVLTNARRLWYWSGAASLSQLAMEGTSQPAKCKFPIAVAEITILTVIEVIAATEAAKTSIEGVKVWQA